MNHDIENPAVFALTQATRIAGLETQYAELERAELVRDGLWAADRARLAAVIALCDQMRDEGWAWEYAEPKLRAAATGDTE